MFASTLNLSNPKLPLFSTRAKNAVDLALVKVVAHRQNPSQNPLPSDPKSLERAFNDLFNALPKRRQDDAMEKYQSLLSPAARAQAFGDLAQVSFSSATSIVDQVKALPLPAELHFTQAEVADLQKQIMARKIAGNVGKHIGHHVGSAAQAAAPRQAVASEMKFEIISATCVKPNDLKKDEINMVFGTFDGLGVPLNAGPFFAGKFKKGETIDLTNTAPEFNFKIAEVTFPASFPAFAFMIESDRIHNVELATKLSAAFVLTGAAIKTVAAAFLAVGMAGVLTAEAALVGFIIAAIVGEAFTITGRYIMPILSDDVSDASSDTLALDAAPAPGSVFERNLTIDGFGDFNRGSYNVLLRWTAS